MKAKHLIESLEDDAHSNGLFTLEEAEDLIDIIQSFGFYSDISVSSYAHSGYIVYARKSEKLPSDNEASVHIKPGLVTMRRRAGTVERLTFSTTEQLLSILSDNL